MALRKYDEAGLDYTDLQPRNFKGYFFTRNPFPPIPIAEEEPRIFIDREKVIKAISDVTKETFITKKSQTLLLQGLFGSGKSHTLKYVKSKINSQLATQPKSKGIAVYVQSPGSDIRHFYSNIVEDLGLNFLQMQSYRLIWNFLKDKPHLIDDNFFDEGLKRKTRTLLSSGGDEFLFLRENFNRSGVRVLDVYESIKQEFEPKMAFGDVLTAFLNLTNEDNAFLAWRWLLAENLKSDERNELRVSKNFEDGNDVLKGFNTLKTLLAITGFDTIFILVDEFEKISELHPLPKSRYFDDFRHFIDLNPGGVCLILCVTPAGWAEIQSGGHPLARRLMVNVYWLEPFDLEKTASLINAYIAIEREQFTSNQKIKKEDLYKQMKEKEIPDLELFPFTRDSVKIIHRFSGGVVSEILRTCKTLIDVGCDEGYIIFTEGHTRKLLQFHE